MDGLQNWVRMEVQQRGAQDLAESLVEFKRPDKGKAKTHKTREGGDNSQGKIRVFKYGNEKEGGFKFKKPKHKIGDRPLIKCFLCKGPHRARECPKCNKLLALMEEKEPGGRQGEETSMGSLQLVTA